jgi:hypothetical protein
MGETDSTAPENKAPEVFVLSQSCNILLGYELTSGPRGYKSSCVRIVRRRLVYGVV